MKKGKEIKMEITRKNYESYFIDYLEGNLDERLVDEFIEFLQKNPDLKEELSLFEPVSIQPEQAVFGKKEKLYKHKFDSEKVFSNIAVAYLEGDLSSFQKNEFEKYLAENPEKKKELTFFKQSKLIPDKSIVYQNKKKLYRYTLGRTMLLWSGRVAAVLVLAIALFSILENNKNVPIPENQVAKVETESTKNDVIPETKRIPVVQKEENVSAENEKNLKKPNIKNPEPVKKSNTRLREDTKGRIKHEEVTQRKPLEMPKTMLALAPDFRKTMPEVRLAAMNVQHQSATMPNDERLLADVVREKNNLDNINLNKIAKAGLNLISGLTNDNFSYKTNNEGTITEYKYDSRLLAFSIPARNETDGE